MNSFHIKRSFKKETSLRLKWLEKVFWNKYEVLMGGKKKVYEGSEQVERSRKEGVAEIEMKSKLERNLFGCIKNLFCSRRAKLKGQVVARIKLY